MPFQQKNAFDEWIINAWAQIQAYTTQLYDKWLALPYDNKMMSMFTILFLLMVSLVAIYRMRYIAALVEMANMKEEFSRKSLSSCFSPSKTLSASDLDEDIVGAMSKSIQDLYQRHADTTAKLIGELRAQNERSNELLSDTVARWMEKDTTNQDAYMQTIDKLVASLERVATQDSDCNCDE